MIAGLICLVAVLSLIPALNGLRNLALLKTPALPATNAAPAAVTILIPARDEEQRIGACLRAALASRGVLHDVIVLDDGSSDRTASIVEAIARYDPRLRLLSGAQLDRAVKGKAAACQALAEATQKPFLLFIDADVTLAPDAAARLVPPPGIDLVSGVPRQLVSGVVPTAVIPMIATLLIGYLPLGRARREQHRASLAAACGQLMMIRAEAYRAVGGHASVKHFLHEALQLARRFRAQGYGTDLVDLTGLATCRMYEDARAVFAGFGKNATEGMARPLALPVWTVLLAGGHLLPVVTVPLAWWSRDPWLLSLAVGATGLLAIARVLQKMKLREPVLAVLLHPLGIGLALSIQYAALFRALRGHKVQWKGRSYSPQI